MGFDVGMPAQVSSVKGNRMRMRGPYSSGWADLEPRNLQPAMRLKSRCVLTLRRPLQCCPSSSLCRRGLGPAPGPGWGSWVPARAMYSAATGHGVQEEEHSHNRELQASAGGETPVRSTVPQSIGQGPRPVGEEWRCQPAELAHENHHRASTNSERSAGEGSPPAREDDLCQ